MRVYELVHSLTLDGIDPNAPVRVVVGRQNNLLVVSDIEWVQEYDGSMGEELLIHHEEGNTA